MVVQLQGEWLLLGCHGLESDAARFRVRRDGGRTGNPLCKLCNSGEEDPEHFLSTCNQGHEGLRTFSKSIVPLKFVEPSEMKLSHQFSGMAIT